MQIKPYVLNEASLILSWLSDFNESSLWSSRKEFPLPPDVFDMWHVDPDMLPFTGTIDGLSLVYGSILLDELKSEAEIMRLVVSNEHRRQGLGVKFIETVLEKIKSKPIKTIYARHFPWNKSSIGCFLKAGFQEVSEDLRVEMNEWESIDFIWMEYTL